MRLRGEGVRARGAPVEITYDGQRLDAQEGETVAAALSAAGVIALRTTRSGAPRGLWCGMGACFECLITIDGRVNQRACLVKVHARMRVESAADGRAALVPPPAREPERREADVLVVGA